MKANRLRCAQLLGPVSSVSEAQYVAQDMVAVDLADSGLALPALAEHFTACSFATFGNDLCKFLAQIKIAADARRIRTQEVKHRLGVNEVDRVFEFTLFGDASRVKASQHHAQRLQSGEPLREAH